MRPFHKTRPYRPSPLAALGLVVCLAITSPRSCDAQSKPKSPPVNTRLLDMQAQKIQQDFVKGLGELVTQYESAGERAKAMDLLKSMLKLDPNLDAAKTKLKELEEAVFDERIIEIEIDASGSWVSAGVVVSKGEPFRVESTGTYKLMVNETLGPAGMQTNDPTRDLVTGIPCGALMGMIVDGNRPRRGRSEPPVPFAIGAAEEITPKASGSLFLKLNTPSRAKCIGKVKATVSGNISRGR